MFENSVNIEGRSQQSVTASNQTTDPLNPGVYDIWGDDDIYIKVHATNAADVTSATGYLIRAGQTVPLQITKPSYLGNAGPGTLYYHKVG